MTAYLRDPETGDVYLEADNPQAAWTSEEWATKIKSREDLLVQLHDQLASAISVKIEPDQDTLALWNSMAGEQRRPLEEEIGRLQVEINEMKAV